MKQYILIIISLLLFASCEKVLDVEIDDSNRLMVLNAVPSSGKPLSVNFTYSHFFLDTVTLHPVQGARIAITVNGTRMSPSQISGCNYYFPYTLNDDDRLHIDISANGQNISADTYVPRSPQISNLEAHVDTSHALTLLNIDFDLADHANYSDYYHFIITSRDSGQRRDIWTDSIEMVDTIVNKMFLCFDQLLASSDVVAVQPLAGYFFNRLLTTDSLIDGRNHHVRLQVIMLVDTNEIAPFTHQYTLEVETITLDRFRYLRDADNATSMPMLIADPMPVYTNVKGGYGIFAGNARKSFALSFDTIAAPASSPLPDGLPYTLMHQMQHRYR